MNVRILLVFIVHSLVKIPMEVIIVHVRQVIHPIIQQKLVEKTLVDHSFFSSSSHTN